MRKPIIQKNTRKQKRISPRSIIEQVLIDQFHLEGYNNGDPINVPRLVKNAFNRVGEEMLGNIPVMAYTCIEFWQDVARRLFKLGQREENRVTQLLLDGLPDVNPRYHQVLLDFGDRRAYDPQLGDFVDVFTMSSEQARRCGLYDIDMGRTAIKKGRQLLRYSKMLKADGK